MSDSILSADASASSGNESSSILETSASVSSGSESTSTVESTNDGVSNSTPSAADGVTPPPPAYTPNLKFKYYDPKENKQIEKEFDAWAKSAIKDAQSEKELRDLYEKAYGLEPVKSSREKFKLEAEQLRGEVRDIKKSLNIVSGYVQNGDMQSFFEALKIPEEKVLKYAMERLQYREWTPQQRAEYDQLRSTRARAEYLEEQNAALQQSYAETAAQHRSAELDRTLSDPNVASVMEQFDARMGQPGAFKQEVIRRGQYYWHQFQKDIPVEQAVREVLQLAGGVNTPSQQQAPVAQSSGPSPAPEAKPIIPNIQGSGSSPAKKRPKSIADLKKIAQGMTG